MGISIRRRPGHYPAKDSGEITMKNAPLAFLALALGWSSTTMAAQPAAPAPAAACDRECLRGAITAYLHALVRHDVSQLPLADKVRITEDCVEKTIDKVGLVRSVTKIRGYRQDFLDERQGVAGADVVVEEGGAPVMLVVRLKINGEKITEIETLATRSKADGTLFRIDGVESTTAAMNYAPRISQLDSREEMIRIAADSTFKPPCPGAACGGDLPEFPFPAFWHSSRSPDSRLAS
jgi:hypothetical protein